MREKLMAAQPDVVKDLKMDSAFVESVQKALADVRKGS